MTQVGPAARYRGSGHPGVPVDRNPGAAQRIRYARAETPAERRSARRWLLAWALARRLPEPVVFTVADLLGRAAYRWVPRLRARVQRNVAPLVDGDQLDRVVRDAFRSYARYWVEAFRAADLDPVDLDRRTTTDGFVHMDGVLEQGRGVVVLLAHHGSWDVAARWAETHGYHLAVVAEVVRPRRLFEEFVRLREAIGLEVVPLRRGEDLVARLGAVLAANHLVGLLADRDLTGNAPVMRMFGRECRIPLGPAVLAHRYQVPIVPVTMLQRPGRRWHLQILPPILPDGRSVGELHHDVVRSLEDLIRLDVTQWHAFQPVWLDRSSVQT